MPIISRATIQNIKQRVDILDVVSNVVALKRAGSKYKGLSPFNQEKTPSFFVSPDKGLYKCFSSGKAGDVISFVMETEGLTFTEAVETLGRRYGIPIEYEKGGISNQERSLRRELFDIHEHAAELYRQAFLADDEAGRFIRRYWQETRQFSLDVAEDFKIGLAPPDGGALLSHLRKRGFSDQALRQCGLFFLSGDTPRYERFRGRLMIPIRDSQGRIVAFTGRQLDITPADDPAREAKYVNSPETPIFTKGKILFNFDRSRKHARDGAPFLMVEGQLDAIRCWSVGLHTVIAPQGTGVTEDQCRLLQRFHTGLEVVLDGDRAGQAAALRLLPLALAQGLEVTFLPLPEGADPDDYIRENGEHAVETLRNRHLPAIQFAIRALAPDVATMSAQQISDACRQLFEIIHRAPSEVARAEYLAEIAAGLRLSRTAVDADYRAFRESAQRRETVSAALSSRPAADSAPAAEPVAAPVDEGRNSAEHDLLLLALQYEDLGRPLAETIAPEWINTSTRAGRLLDLVLNEFLHDTWAGTQWLQEHLDDPADKAFIASLLFDAPEIDQPERVANDGIRQMINNFCAPKMREIELEIAAKQGKFDADLISLLKTNEELRKLRLNPPTLRLPV